VSRCAEGGLRFANPPYFLNSGRAAHSHLAQHALRSRQHLEAEQEGAAGVGEHEADELLPQAEVLADGVLGIFHGGAVEADAPVAGHVHDDGVDAGGPVPVAALVGEELAEDAIGVLVGGAAEDAHGVVVEGAGAGDALAFDVAAGVVAVEAHEPLEPLAQGFAEQGVVGVGLVSCAGHGAAPLVLRVHWGHWRRRGPICLKPAAVGL